MTGFLSMKRAFTTMNKTHPGRLPFPLLAALAFCLALAASPLRAQSGPYTGMVAFGDSLSDGGNLNSLLNGLAPENEVQHLTGWDPDYYYNFRFSNGPVWVDYLYTSLGFGLMGSMGTNDGVNKMDGTNFSWAGSRSGAGFYRVLFPNLQPQIGSYVTQLAASNPALSDPATTLFTIWSGANDVFASVEYADPVTPAQVAGNIATAINTLYASGGRSFLVPNLPPIGMIPSYLNDPVKGPQAEAFVNTYNALLDAQLDALSGSLEGIDIIKVDVHGLFLLIMDDPEAYGFTNVTDTAYVRYGEEPYPVRDPPYGELAPNSEGYFYWDAAHGTTAANALIAQAAYEAVIPEPSTLGYLLLLGLLALGRRPFSRTLSTIGNQT